MKRFDIVTIFPNSFDSYFNESIVKRAKKSGTIEINFHNPRDFTKDKHKSVDDAPYGGGPGMILMVEPIDKALKKIPKKRKRRVIMTSPAGKKFDHTDAVRLAQYDQLIILCGRYEGFDARVDDFVDEKISIGDYVLSGGELPAMVITEAVARHVPGVLGNADTLREESFTAGLDYVEYPQYTRPENYKGKKVPKVLLSGHHAEIKKWRQQQAKKN